MSAINIALLSVSVVLQLLLLTLLLIRQMASQLRLFAVLIGFYAVRSVLLAVIFRWISPGSYVATYTALSAVDVLLQIALAMEFTLLLVRAGQKPNLPRALIGAAIFLIAAALAFGIAALLPAYSRAPADRADIFTGLLFLGIFLWSSGVRLAGWQRAALTGLAGIGAAGIVTQVGRSLAAIHQNASAYRLWSYANALIYLTTIVVWIAYCTLGTRSTLIREGRLGAANGTGSSERGTFSPQLPV